MAQWISIEEASAKYGFETEYIWVLIEMREITVDYERSGIDIISDDSVQEFMSRNEKGATLMYIEKLERYCIDKSKLCSIYLSLLGKQDKEITRYKAAGILYDTNSGNDLVICFLSENLTDTAAAQSTIAQLSRTIYLTYNG